jgi:hypothetical protein
MQSQTRERKITQFVGSKNRLQQICASNSLHDWAHTIRVHAETNIDNPLLQSIASGLLDMFRNQGHAVQERPDAKTDLLLTSAEFGIPLDWRKALLFNQRRRYKIEHKPPILSLLHATPNKLGTMLNQLQTALAKQPPNPDDFYFPGMASSAYKVLIEQGQRGGPILSLERVLQSQAKCIRILLIVGDDRPMYAHLFNLVGAHPRIPFDSPDRFYAEIVNRLVTDACSHEVTNHRVLKETISLDKFHASNIPAAMRRASTEFGKRHFFTNMVRIADLVNVPALDAAIADQYSEGCFATWDPRLNALIATVTGSARPVDKGNLTDDDLSVIVGVQPDSSGAVVMHVEGKGNDSPSSEAVEMMDMDQSLPRITLDSSWPLQVEVPIVRSKLHGHRGIAAYDPEIVEHVYLDTPYYHFPVSCSTDSQARAIKAAFARSEALLNPLDPRRVVFTVLPGHGIVLAEKWIPGKAPFQIIWEYFDAGVIEVVKDIPQGPLAYIPNTDGRMILQAAEI